MLSVDQDRKRYPTFEAFAKATMAIGTAPEVIVNPFSRQSMELDPLAVAIHDFIKGSEMTNHAGSIETFYDAIAWFQLYRPEAYAVLLD